MTISLKHSASSYPERLVRFMDLIDRVKGQSPSHSHLWEVMDSVAFADTEAALQTALYNSGHKDI